MPISRQGRQLKRQLEEDDRLSQAATIGDLELMEDRLMTQIFECANPEEWL